MDRRTKGVTAAWSVLMLFDVPAQMVRTRRARNALSESLAHQVVALPEPGRWPGYVLCTHSPPIWQVRDRLDVAHAATVLLDDRDSLLKILNFGSVEEAGTAVESTDQAIAMYSKRGVWSYSPIESERIAGEQALRIRAEIGPLQITEWRFVHRGWLFCVGAHGRTTVDEAAVLSRARQVLATWQWLEASTA